jgi:RNA polymerase sigma-70 factor (ECF subfamily)
MGREEPPSGELETADRRRRFRDLYDGSLSRLYGFVTRSLLGNPAQIDDVVADIYLTVWRRIDDVPAPPDDLLWLYGVARKVIAHHRRADGRRLRLVVRLHHERPPGTTHGDAANDEVLDALGGLGQRDREVIQLVIWERLSHREAAEVLACTENAVRIRLHRAKRRLAHRLELDTRNTASDVPALTTDLEMPT